MAKLYLQLATGQIFEGESFGSAREVLGEIVFTTGVVGYLESMTDPCYRGQILVGTFPSAGGYGVIPDDALTGEPQVRAFIVREVCDAPSNYRSAGTLEDYMKKHDLVGVSGIDTRALTEIIREAGVMNARITTEKPTGAPDARLLGYKVEGAVAEAASRTTGIHPAVGETKHRVALIDCGEKLRTVDALTHRGCMVTVCSPTASAEAILAAQPDGIVITAGPGDPADNVEIVATLRALWGKVPMMGIGLGHQLLALAAGARTVKLKYGHRGSNQPVRDTRDGRVYITAQNHGYAVVPDSLPEGAELTHVNVNDGSCEGIAYPAARAFGVQHDPFGSDAALGTPIFDRFITMIREVDDNAL